MLDMSSHGVSVDVNLVVVALMILLVHRDSRCLLDVKLVVVALMSLFLCKASWYGINVVTLVILLIYIGV